MVSLGVRRAARSQTGQACSCRACSGSRRGGVHSANGLPGAMMENLLIFVAGFIVGLVAGILGAVVYPKRKDVQFQAYLKREYGVKESNKT